MDDRERPFLTSTNAFESLITATFLPAQLCDLFLVLIADSVYDSRSRVFLERVADRLGLTELDVTRFEKRVTDALEIQEGVEKLEQEDVIEGRRRQGKKKRYAMLGLATLGELFFKDSLGSHTRPRSFQPSLFINFPDRWWPGHRFIGRSAGSCHRRRSRGCLGHCRCHGNDWFPGRSGRCSCHYDRRCPYRVVHCWQGHGEAYTRGQDV
jgi:hypothetical protein